MITHIYIDNFKSLVEFNLDLGEFNCLVGLNGSGKSTVLHALDFLSQLMKGDLDEWLSRRKWDAADINSKLTAKSNIEFKLTFSHQEWGEIIWSGSINRKTLHCTKERVDFKNGTALHVEDAQCKLMDADAPISSLSISKKNSDLRFIRSERFPIMFEYQGSVLSQLKDSQLHPVLFALKKMVISIRSLDLLSPELLRSKNKESGGNLGLGGERLSAFIHELDTRSKLKLESLLQKVYPQVSGLSTKSLRSGWKQLEITETFSGKELKSKARHVNDGMLRLMAIFSQLETSSNFLLFDEIENGINPELVEYLVDHLVNARHQVLITTHSPMILNYLEDGTARNSITYLYKNETGHTQSIKLFDIPSMAKKLEIMGPGEVFIDTDLTHLIDEILSLEQV